MAFDKKEWELMRVLTWLKSLVGGNRNELADDFEIAKNMGAVAGTWLILLYMVDLDAPKWAAKEPHYMAGYLQGYADVVAQAMGRETGSMLGQNIALQFALTLFGAAPSNSFIEFSMGAEGAVYDLGLADGCEDGNGFVSKKTQIANILSKHLGIEQAL